MELTLAIVGLVLSVFSIGYAFKTTNDKKKLDKLIASRLDDFRESVKDAQKNSESAYKHTETIRRFLSGLRRTAELKEILDCATWAQQDTASTERILLRLENDIVTFNNGLSEESKATEKEKRKVIFKD